MLPFDHIHAFMSNRNNKDLAAKRRETMRKILRERHVVSVTEFSRTLRVSAATVRRDLLALERNGVLQRVHGGAVSRDGAMEEPVFDDKTARAVREKRRIAAAAARMVGRGDSVFLDGGSTVLALALLLRERSDITIVTNSLRVAVELSGGGPRLILTGGELRRLSQTFVGPLTGFLLEQIQAHIAFVGTLGLTVENGMTTTDPNEAFTKRLIMARARRTVLLADSTKIGRTSFVHFGDSKNIHTLITDSNLRAATARTLRKQGIRVTTV